MATSTPVAFLEVVGVLALVGSAEGLVGALVGLALQEQFKIEDSVSL